VGIGRYVGLAYGMLDGCLLTLDCLRNIALLNDSFDIADCETIALHDLMNMGSPDSRFSLSLTYPVYKIHCFAQVKYPFISV